MKNTFYIFLILLVGVLGTACLRQGEDIKPVITTNCDVAKSTDTWMVGNFNTRCWSFTDSKVGRRYSNPGAGYCGASVQGAEICHFESNFVLPFEANIQPLQPNYISIHFIYLPKTVPNLVGNEKVEEEKFVLGKQAWGSNARYPTGNYGRENVVAKNVVAGVRIDRLIGLDQYVSDIGEQPTDSYFEITKLEPHLSNPDLVWMTAKFSCSLSKIGKPQQKYKIENAEFRMAVVKPDYVLKGVWLDEMYDELK